MSIPAVGYRSFLTSIQLMLFQLENVTKTYGSITALNSLSVAVPKGAIGLLGPNGSGKTTLIRTLLGLISIDSGQGTVLGLDILREQQDIRREVGFAPEDECLFPAVDGVGFVAYAGELVGMNPKDALQRAHEVMDYVTIREERYRLVESYSTGMKQKLRLAAAIVHDPELLILDEPTNGLDPKGREEVLELARDLAHNKNMSVLFSSHLLPDVEYVCDHVVVLGAGKRLAEGQIKDLKQTHRQTFDVRVKANSNGFVDRLTKAGCQVEAHEDMFRVEVPQGKDTRVLWEAAAASGEQIRHLRAHQSTLEDVFIHAVEQP